MFMGYIVVSNIVCRGIFVEGRGKRNKVWLVVVLRWLVFIGFLDRCNKKK